MPHDANSRQPLIDLALDRQSEEFKAAYESVLMEFVASGMCFIGEDVQHEYRRRHLIEPTNWRSVGGIYQRLVKKGLVEHVGYGKRNQGNPTPMYRGIV